MASNNNRGKSAPRNGKSAFFEDMGRPVDDVEWLTTFHDAFLDMMDSDTDFSPRQVPGVLYVLGRELKGAHFKIKLFHDVFNTTQAIEKLTNENVIDRDTAASNLGVKVNRLIVKPVRSRALDIKRFDVVARVMDATKPKPLTGFVIGEEKAAIQQAVGTDIEFRDRRSDEDARRYLALGTISCAPEHPKITELAMYNLQRTIPPSLELGPVGEMKAFF